MSLWDCLQGNLIAQTVGSAHAVLEASLMDFRVEAAACERDIVVASQCEEL